MWLEHGYNLGGEQSGHVIFLDDKHDRQRIVKRAAFIGGAGKDRKAVVRAGFGDGGITAGACEDAKVPNHKKESFLEYQEIADAIACVEKKFNGEGRVLIRPSGTEPLVRVMIEGKRPERDRGRSKKAGGADHKEYVVGNKGAHRAFCSVLRIGMKGRRSYG